MLYICEMEPTHEQINEYCQKLIAKFKQDQKWELQQEFGRMLMRHIDSFTEEERKRYEELKRLLIT
jgi:HKD family nuclease